MNTEATNYPLTWPDGWPRTPQHKQAASKFGGGMYNKPSVHKATQELLAEINRMGGRKVILSTNVKLRNDGLPYSSNMREPDDKGAVVYFEMDGEPMCIACDQYKTTGCNITGLARTIEALRAIERYGASELMKRAFTGFKALPQYITVPPRPWWDVLACSEHADEITAKSSYRECVKMYHPDTGTLKADEAKYKEVVEAWERAKKLKGWK